ncbi:MAG: VOC family protein [Pseudomonadota bacterium]
MPRLHHVTLVVRNLEQRKEEFEKLLGIAPTMEALPARGVLTARFELDGLYLILVQPVREDSVPGERLASHGEGVFMLSLATPSLEQSDAELKDRGMMLAWDTLRTGLDGWRVADVKHDDELPLVIQFAQTDDHS